MGNVELIKTSILANICVENNVVSFTLSVSSLLELP